MEKGACRSYSIDRHPRRGKEPFSSLFVCPLRGQIGDYMGDIFNEYLIRKLPGTSDFLKKAGIGVVAVLIMALGFMYAGMMVFLIIAGVGFGVYYLYKGFDIEYEYILTNDELDVDKVIARERRKHLLTVKVTDFDILAPCSEDYKREYEQTSITKKIDVSSSPKSPKRKFAIYNQGNDKILLIFEPPQKMLDGIKTLIPRRVKD
jgi:uncharacterized membrane protein